MHVHDLSEFSDHCPIEFHMTFNKISGLNENESVSKIIWNDNKKDELNEKLVTNAVNFDNIIQSFQNNEFDLNVCIDKMSDMIYDISYQLHGKSFSTKKGIPKHKKIELV